MNGYYLSLFEQNVAKNQHNPWIEKYRASIDEIVSQNHIVSAMKKYINDKNVPDLILHGPPGTGKTSIIKDTLKKLYGPGAHIMSKYINASCHRGMDVVNNIINGFINSTNHRISMNVQDPNMFRFIILDEADSLTKPAQVLLRQLIGDGGKDGKRSDNITSSENMILNLIRKTNPDYIPRPKTENNVRFCLICNDIEKLQEPLRSRCINFGFTPLSAEAIKERLKFIVQKENLTFITDEKLIFISNNCSFDMRNAINKLWNCSVQDNENNELQFQNWAKERINTLLFYRKSMNYENMVDSFNFLLKEGINYWDYNEFLKILLEIIIKSPELSNNFKSSITEKISKLETYYISEISDENLLNGSLVYYLQKF